MAALSTVMPARAVRMVGFAPSQSSIQANAIAPRPDDTLSMMANTRISSNDIPKVAANVHAAEREQRVQTVDIDHLCAQEDHDVAVRPQPADRRDEPGASGACRGDPSQPAACAIGHQQEQRHRKHREPDRRKRVRDPHMLGRFAIETEGRRVRLHEDHEA